MLERQKIDYFAVLSENLEVILNHIDDGIYISDKFGNTVWVNDVYEDVTGISRSDVMHRNLYDLQREGLFSVVLNPEVVRTKKRVQAAAQLKNGKHVVINAKPILDKNGDVELVMAFNRDATHINKLNTLIQDQEELISSVTQHIATIQGALAPETQPIIGDAHSREALELLRRISKSGANFLLLGETGVGKDVFAREAHKFSPRHEAIFLKVNCGGISEHLVESELFGYAPGSFSGADPRGKMGYFEAANGGTIFLDEIGELPLNLQSRLLWVLQDKEIVRVGANDPIKVDVRIIAATNKDLEEEVRQGRFREDLFYRLNVASITVPPLRKRPKDIALLLDHFIGYYNKQYGKQIALSEDVLDQLQAYSWPGNVRELKNFIENTIITSKYHTISMREIPDHMRAGAPAIPDDIEIPMGDYKEMVAAFEYQLLTRAIREHGSVDRAAKALKMDRSTIFRKLGKVRDK